MTRPPISTSRLVAVGFVVGAVDPLLSLLSPLLSFAWCLIAGVLCGAWIAADRQEAN